MYTKKSLLKEKDQLEASIADCKKELKTLENKFTEAGKEDKIILMEYIQDYNGYLLCAKKRVKKIKTILKEGNLIEE